MTKLDGYDLVYGTHKMTTGLDYGLGYGIIDTATGYNNAIQIRDAIFRTTMYPTIISKFNPCDFENDIENVITNHVMDLGKYPDIVLLHSPFKTNYENLSAVSILKEQFSDKLIGVSNFDMKQLMYLIDNNFIPDVIQIEFHPLFQPTNLVEYCHSKGIKIMGYRPFGKGSVLNNETILNIAKDLGVEPAHLVLKWVKSKNIIPVVSSNNPKHVVFNKLYQNVKLDDATIKKIDNLNMGTTASTCMVRFSQVDPDTQPIF
ncbi:hypothetical protein QJ857_gp0758 [Tupanvirus soda lake]|uniref:NADP-dependent oxidoreductase domain-containing protein n=2 Tax=Tupanvirus TaxID=2094720 RepID=A0A6N1NMU3_9VIRU|nr:hypothetical protein QJ857_gp0758 [Tupanvirus soda lake]QKU35290.1 hypothetical protein [Tupanvirus soda lake]